MRGWEDTITPEKLVAQFFDFFNSSMPAVYMAYAKWLDSKAYCFRFEDLFMQGQENQRVFDGLADYLGKPRKIWTKESIIGGTPTWTGKLSNWQDFWFPEIDKVWREEGMVEVEKALGYDNH